jgi:hypothetical protein
MILQFSAISLACAVGAAIGILVAMRWCAHRHRCIRQQRRDVQRWTKDITGEITRKMQVRLAKREAARVTLRDTGANPATVDKPISAHTENIRPPRTEQEHP